MAQNENRWRSEDRSWQDEQAARGGGRDWGRQARGSGMDDRDEARDYGRGGYGRGAYEVGDYRRNDPERDDYERSGYQRNDYQRSDSPRSGPGWRDTLPDDSGRSGASGFGGYGGAGYEREEHLRRDRGRNQGRDWGREWSGDRQFDRHDEDGRFGRGEYGADRSAGPGGGDPTNWGRSDYGRTGWGRPDRHRFAQGDELGGGRYGYGRHESRDRDDDRYRERSFWTMAGDEVASWFGDSDAERRREEDERRMRERGRHGGRGPRGYTRSDARIHEDVNDRLTEDPVLDATDIEVRVENGEVTLSGMIDHRMAKRRAEDVAESVTGVRHVQNNLRVRERTGDQATAVGGVTSGNTAAGAAAMSGAARTSPDSDTTASASHGTTRS